MGDRQSVLLKHNLWAFFLFTILAVVVGLNLSPSMLLYREPASLHEPRRSVEAPAAGEQDAASAEHNLKSRSIVAVATPLSESVLAFPGAEGFGARTIGGRGGRIIEVTNRHDRGPGSLRAALEAEGPRTVVFRIGGIIQLNRGLEINNPYITIAGQTAPAGGITLRNNPDNREPTLRIKSHDVIIRYMRFRPGPSKKKSGVLDPINIGVEDHDVYNIIIDHSSFSWGTDETVSIWYAARNITVQWSIIAEALRCSTHREGCHGKGMLIGSHGGGRVSIHHNLFAHNDDRNPMIKTDGSGTIDVVNNVIYNMGTGVVSYDNYGVPPINVVANFFKYGVNTEPNRFEITTRTAAGEGGGFGHALYVQGNIGPNRLRDDLDDFLSVHPDSRAYLVDDRHDAPPVTTVSATEAYYLVLHNAGATLPVRDVVDSRIVNDVVNSTGQWIDEPKDVGGWPKLIEGLAPDDLDRDGMPNAWEEANGLDANDPADGPQDYNGDGYTNLEDYLNALAAGHSHWLSIINE